MNIQWEQNRYLFFFVIVGFLYSLDILIILCFFFSYSHKNYECMILFLFLFETCFLDYEMFILKKMLLIKRHVFIIIIIIIIIISKWGVFPLKLFFSFCSLNYWDSCEYLF